MFVRLGLQEILVLFVILLVAAPIVLTAVIAIITFVRKHSRGD